MSATGTLLRYTDILSITHLVLRTVTQDLASGCIQTAYWTLWSSSVKFLLERVCVHMYRCGSGVLGNTENYSEPAGELSFSSAFFPTFVSSRKKKRFALRYTAGLRSLIQRVVQPILLSAILTPIHLHSDLIPRSPRGLISINHASHESARPAFLPR